MLNDNERDDRPEEGEYHFSDEGGYDLNNREEEGAKGSAVTERSGFASQFSSYRRFVIMGGIFAGVLLVAYLVVAPPVTMPTTEITEAATTEQASPTASVPDVKKSIMSSVKVATKQMEKQHIPALKMVVVSAVSSEKPKAEPLPSSMTTPQASPPLAAGEPSATVPISAVLSAAVQPVAISPVEVPANPTMTPPQETPLSIENKMLSDRLSVLEATNTRLIGQLQSEYASKLAEFQTQDKVVEEQIRTLNTKISGIEAQMNQLLQVLNKQQQQQPLSSSPPVIENPNVNDSSSFTLPSSSAAPSSSKASYSVQAIIPGRAWLRADNGETVTVAEGDVLKNIGRVTKIDPYDGIIQIDTGTKMITLTYGNGDYA